MRQLIERRRSALGLILLTGLLLRSYGLDNQSLWIEEIYSIVIRGSRPASEILFAPATDIHPPLHYLLLHYWMELFGGSVLATRAYTVIIGVAGIFVVYVLGTSLFNVKVGLIGAALLAVSPMHIHASRTVEIYGLLLLLSVVSLYGFVKLFEGSKSQNITLYLIATVLLLLTHLYGIFILVAQNAYVLSAHFSDSEHHQPYFSLPQWFSLQALLGIVALPGLFRALQVTVPAMIGTTDDYIGWIPEMNIYRVLETFLYYSGFPNYYPYLVDSTGIRLLSYLVLGIAVLCFGVAFGEHQDQSQPETLVPRKPEVDGLYLLSAVLASVILLPFAISKLLNPIYLTEPTLPAIVPFFLIVALGVSRLPNERIQTVVAVLLVGSLLLSGGVYFSTNSEEPWNEVAPHVESSATSDDLVVFHSDWLVHSYNYYSQREDYDTTGYSQEFTEEEVDQLQTQADNNERIWIVTRSASDSEPVIETVDSTHSLVAHDQFGQIEVYLFVDGENEAQQVAENDTTNRQPSFALTTSVSTTTAIPEARRSPIPRVNVLS
ncbi:glycosyltransferase family 39 protein [Halalkalicoccus salilacus]|uniref:glycosyltransferase family 39 protein n=1 Tax=Halalkalicoccus salilacus TaxID=3117459 RepID=UPI00300F0CE0